MLSIFGFFKNYDDGRIEVLAQETFEENPVMERIFSDISINSQKGVVKLEGKVDSQKIKVQVENNIEEKLTKSRVDYDKIENQLEVSD
ncbi:MAG: hypothetical protein ACOC2G_00205 [Bacillota bacterium]